MLANKGTQEAPISLTVKIAISWRISFCQMFMKSKDKHTQDKFHKNIKANEIVDQAMTKTTVA